MTHIPAPGSRWRHRRDGSDASIVDLPYGRLKTKGPSDATWHDAVAYDDRTGTDVLLVRRVDDFLDKFEPIDPSEYEGEGEG